MSLNRAFAALSPSGFSHSSASLIASFSSLSQFLEPERLEVGYAIPLEVDVKVDDSRGVVVLGADSRAVHFKARTALANFKESFVDKIS